MALSDMTVRHARITGNDYTLGDSDGLALNVTSRGGKIWRFRYYWAGKLLDLLSRIEQRKALTTAEKCRTWLNHCSDMRW